MCSLAIDFLMFGVHLGPGNWYLCFNFWWYLRGGSLTCMLCHLYAMDSSSDLPLEWQLLTSWYWTLQPSLFDLCTCIGLRHWWSLNWDQIYGTLYVSDREGHGHWAVLYKSHFPPLRHSFRQRHHCIHRLINHVYYQRTKPFVIHCPTTWWQLG